MHNKKGLVLGILVLLIFGAIAQEETVSTSIRGILNQLKQNSQSITNARDDIIKRIDLLETNLDAELNKEATRIIVSNIIADLVIFTSLYLIIVSIRFTKDKKKRIEQDRREREIKSLIDEVKTSRSDLMILREQTKDIIDQLRGAKEIIDNSKPVKPKKPFLTKKEMIIVIGVLGITLIAVTYFGGF